MNDKETVEDIIKESDVILIGLGEELSTFEKSPEEIVKLQKGYQYIREKIRNKNYFVISLNDDRNIVNSVFEEEYTVFPCIMKDDDPKWEKYLKWLSCTLNHRLCVLELGVLLNRPNIIRWPFERCVMVNNNAKLIRINMHFPQLPLELAEKGISIKENVIDFCLAE